MSTPSELLAEISKAVKVARKNPINKNLQHVNQTVLNARREMKAAFERSPALNADAEYKSETYALLAEYEKHIGEMIRMLRHC